MIADARTCTATVSTPQDPAPRTFPIRVCAVRSVSDGRALVVVPRAHDDRLLAWTPIQAPAIHPIADLGRYGAWEATQATMNETDVAYALGSCWGIRVYRASLAEPGTPATLPQSCPVLVPARHATLTPNSVGICQDCEDEHRGVTYSRITRVVLPIDLEHVSGDAHAGK